MSWTTFPTLTDSQVLTGAHMQLVRDNLAETAPAKASAAGQIFVVTGANAIAARVPTNAIVATNQPTTSTSYVNLATVGPSVTVTTGARAIVMPGSAVSNTGAGQVSYASYDVSSATTIAADDARALVFESSGISQAVKATAVYMETALTPGSNVFTMKYRCSGGTSSFSSRHLVVIPL